MEKFKRSNKSICAKCINVDEKCSTSTVKMCGTDSSIHLAYVMKCSHYNKDINAIHKKSSNNNFKISARPDTRIEMMGGGYE